MIPLPRISWCALSLLIGLHALDVRAQSDDGEESCRVVSQDGAPARLDPPGERTQRACSAKWCAGLNHYNMGYSHFITCLYVTDKAGTPTSTLSLDHGMEGLKTVRFLADDRIELSYSTCDRSWSEVYALDARGQLPRPRPPPPPSARQRHEQQVLKRKQEAEYSRRLELEARSSCQHLDEEPSCGEQSLPEEVRERLGQACGQPAGGILGVCSKAGCMGLVRTHTGEARSYCIAWAPQRGPAIVVPTASEDLRSIILDGSFICLNKVRSINGWTAYSMEECVDMSGPVARLVREPPGKVSGNADYEILPYRGEAPLIDGKALELEWKAPTLEIATAALVGEGLEAWRDARDASAEWIFRSRDEELLFLLRVHDDQVVAGELPEHNDGVSLKFFQGEESSHELRVLLAPAGRVSTTGASHARCAWSATGDGYRMECAVPLKELGLPRVPSAWTVRVGVEDRDGRGEPLTRLSTFNRLVAWSEFPPPWNEAARLSPWEPCP
ncbi:hypothetical protein [Cystobacter ferrugineus]|uniref:Carbohydrate-binding domain-containing protein n=1 Tax=Cystobacter ferrugineus TaxID=83449 RepID=A0A1L9B9H0_9BACT|nr:hypothetical protein [Cystobacter ferrugineus]OJH38892.1 hypothetical protein BON30_21990 [Cystobacter ferrugineus]